MRESGPFPTHHLCASVASTVKAATGTVLIDPRGVWQEKRTRVDFISYQARHAFFAAQAHGMITVRACHSTGRVAQDPGLLLLVDDRRVPPHACADGVYTFALEAPVREIRLLSRTFVPSRQMPGSPDQRRLGVSVWWMRLRSEQVTIHIRPEHPLLRDGFHAADNGACWTDGFALVPPCFHHLLAGDVTVEIKVGTPDVTYSPAPRDGPPRALVIDETLPTPDRDAGSNVMREHASLLQSLGYAVTFMPANLDACEPYAGALRAEGVEVVAYPFVGTPEQFLAVRGDGFALAYLHRVAIAERMLPLLRRLAPQARVLFNPADLHFLRLERQAALLGSAELRTEQRRCVRASCRRSRRPTPRCCATPPRWRWYGRRCRMQGWCFCPG